MLIEIDEAKCKRKIKRDADNHTLAMQEWLYN